MYVVGNVMINLWTVTFLCMYSAAESLPLSATPIWRSSAIWTRMFRTLTLTSSAKRESCHQSRNGLCMLGWPWFQFDGSFCREAKGRDCKGTHRVSWAKRATLAKRTSWWKLCSLVSYCIICQMGKLTLIWPKLQANPDFQIGSCQGLWFKRCFHYI